MSDKPSSANAFHRFNAMPRKQTPAQAANGLAFQSADVILKLQFATSAHQQAHALVAQLRAHENALGIRLSSLRQTAEDRWLEARTIQALSACEAERAEALAAQVLATRAESPTLVPTTPGYADQLAAFEVAKTELAEKIRAAKTVALSEALRKLDNAKAAEQEAAAARTVDQLYQFETMLRPEQRSNGPLERLFLEHLEVQEMQQDIDAVFRLHCPGSANLGMQEIDLQICALVLNDHQLIAAVNQQIANTSIAKVESIARQIAAAQDQLRDAERDLVDKASAMNEASAAMQQFMQMAAGTMPVATTTTSGVLASIREEEELDLDPSADSTTIGMVIVENTPWFMPHQIMASDWSDGFHPSALKASAGLAITTYLMLFPEVTDALVGLPGEAKADDFSAALA